MKCCYRPNFLGSFLLILFFSKVTLAQMSYSVISYRRLETKDAREVMVGGYIYPGARKAVPGYGRDGMYELAMFLEKP